MLTEKHMTRGQARQNASDEKEHKAIRSQLSIEPGQVWSLFWPDNKSESGLKIRPVFILESSGSRATVAELTGSSARLIKNGDGKLIPAPGEIQLSPKISADIGLRKSSCLRLTQRADVPIKCLIKRLGKLNDADDLNYIIEEAEYLDNNKGNLLDIYRYSRDPHGKKEPVIKKVRDGIYKESVLENSGVKSNGIYSVMNDAWIKEPIKSDIPDIDKDAFNELFREWEDKYFSLLNEIGEKPCAGGPTDKGLLEMALNRNDAMNRCIGLGENFILHFHKIYTDSNNDVRKHWAEEMSCWYKDVKKIIIKSTKKPITDKDLMDWFFTAGSNFETIVKKPSPEESKKYDEFVRDTLSSCDVYAALRNANLLEGFALESFTGANISKSDRINKFIEDLYDLRKKSIRDDGEYGIGNLVFKEMRSRGYLDRLQELKNKARGDELGLESM